jgi:DNA-binding CsgD family transcriptional regulator
LELTAREIEVLKWIADGKSDWQIGQILRISDKTVNFHVENMKRKCGVATRMQVVVRAVHEGKIAPMQD